MTPGGDGIPAEVWKHGGDNLFSRLHQLITNAWELCSVPEAWKDASIVTTYKLQEKCIEQDRPLYWLFVNFSKAFDPVVRTELWQLLRSPQLWSRLCILEWWRMLVLEEKLRNLSELQMRSSNEAFRDMEDCVYIQSRHSPDLFNVAHFSAKTKTTRILMRELLFADDSALVAHFAEEMHKIVDAFSDASKKFGLKINIKKTEVRYQPNTTRTRDQDIMVDGNKLNSVLEFTHLGSTISTNGCTDDEIQRRMAKASASFGRPRQRFWNNHHVSMRVKGKLCRATVLSTLLYRAEAWTVYTRQVKKLNAFMMGNLSSIMMAGQFGWTKWQARTYSNGQDCHLFKIFWSERTSGGLDTSWGCHQTVTRADSLLSKRGHLRFKDTIKRNLKLRDMAITLTAERKMDSNSQVMEAVFVASRPDSMMMMMTLLLVPQ